MKDFERFPMNLQLFAEGSENGGADGGGEAGGSTDEGSKLTYEQLEAELAKARAEADKWKRTNDKTSSESAAWKKKYKERLDSDEAKTEDEKEAQAEKDKELADLRAEVAKQKAVKRFMKVYKMSEEDAEDMADMEAAGDLDGMDAKMQKHLESMEKDAYQNAIKNRHETHAGNGDGKGETLAEKLAKGLAKQSSSTANEEILKNFFR